MLLLVYTYHIIDEYMFQVKKFIINVVSTLKVYDL